MIDWSQEIEVFCNGEWIPAVVQESDKGETQFPYRLSYGPYADQWFTAEGKNCVDHDFVRNTLAVPPTPDERAVAPELVARLVALAKTVANDASEPYSLRHVEDEARAIVSALEPVDPVEEAFTTLEVFLAAYEGKSNAEISVRDHDDDLLTWGHLRTILAYRQLQRDAERVRGEG